MLRCCLTSLVLCLFSAFTFAESPLTEANLRFISSELARASADKNTSVLEKYFYAGTKVVLATEPNHPETSKEYSFAQYLALSQTSSRLVESRQTTEEILAIKIDQKRQQAYVKERLTSLTKTMGLTLKDVVLSNTTYGVINQQVKVLDTHLRWLSSETQ